MSDRRPSRSQDLRDRTFAFSRGVVVFCKRFFRWSEPERTLTRQLARAGISVGGNTEEAAGAQSRPDFLSKTTVSLKEAREVHFVLRVIRESGLDDSEEINRLIREADELVAILTASVKSIKARS